MTNTFQTMYFVYIAYKDDNSLHSIGVTTNLKGRFRLLSHLKKKNLCNCKLVYYESFESSYDATAREDKLNALPEILRYRLVESVNPLMVDLLAEMS